MLLLELTRQRKGEEVQRGATELKEVCLSSPLPPQTNTKLPTHLTIPKTTFFKATTPHRTSTPLNTDLAPMSSHPTSKHHTFAQETLTSFRAGNAIFRSLDIPHN